MERSDHTKVAILGAGRGGHALLELLHHIPSIEIVGIADRNPAAPGLERARELRIPVTHQYTGPDRQPWRKPDYGCHGRSGNGDVSTGQQTYYRRYPHWVGLPTLWELVLHESKLEAELLQSENLRESAHLPRESRMISTTPCNSYWAWRKTSQRNAT